MQNADNLVDYLIVIHVGYLFFWMTNNSHNLLYQVFPKIVDSGNVGNKGLHRKEQNNFKKMLPPMGVEPGVLRLLVAQFVLHSHAILTQLTWKVLGEGYLTFCWWIN